MDDDPRQLIVGPNESAAHYRLRRLRVIWAPLGLIVVYLLVIMGLAALLVLLLPLLAVAFVFVLIVRLLTRYVPGVRRLTSRRGHSTADERVPALPGVLLEAERSALAQRFRPSLMIYPEDPELGPPYRTGERANLVGADYHPRDVGIFLSHARLRQGRTQWLPELPELTDISEIRENLGRPGERASSLETPWLHGGHPLKIFRHLIPIGRQLKTHRAIPIPRGDCGCSTAAWERYVRIVTADQALPPSEQRHPHTIYARVLEGQELPEIGTDHPLHDAVIVQYWFFYFYNDAWNRHQGDWEEITIFLRRDRAAFNPLGAAYASHEEGRWRRWQDVDRVDEGGDPADDGTHPMVYIGRGSHASYFDYNENGYHPSMSRKVWVPFVGEFTTPSKFALEGRNATDWVANDARNGGNGVRIFTENVKLMPPEVVLRDLPRLRQDDEWWWLAYRGLWGAPEFLPFFGESGPRGPQWQGIKWDNPFYWVMRHCIADEMPYWLEMFSAWEPEERPWEEVAMPQETAQREVPA